MATRAEIEQVRRALNRVSAAAVADLRALLVSVDPEDREALRAVLVAVYPELLAEYGTAAGALGADMAAAWADDLRLTPRIIQASVIDAGQAAGVVDWTLARPDVLGNLTVTTDELVKRPFRDTVQQSAHASGAAWARVPTGATTCAFCVMTASRGAVYASSGSAGGDRKWHGGCDCQVVMVRDEADFPDGYNPQDYFDTYSAGWDAAVAEGLQPTTSNVLAGMRKVADLH